MRHAKSMWVFLAVLLIAMSPTAQPRPAVTTVSALPDNLSATEFAHLIAEFSESGGDFLSDNLISNETDYPPVLEKLKELNIAGGAYIGVGPEQNFSYIAKIRPRIAFIVDIRHMAVMQHLMYKALFRLSPDRAQFLSRLLSRPLAKEKALTADASINDLINYFSRVPADEKFYQSNLAEITKTIEKDFQVAVSKSDQLELEYVLKNFRVEGLDISFHFNGSWMSFPTLKEIVLQKDRNGKFSHFLANSEDYNFLRQLHSKNLIIPINGDFGGKKALAAIGNYLRKNDVKVSAFYTSNVEQYLFDDSAFDAFVSNIKKFPVNEQSLIIRSVIDRFNPPSQASGHLFTMLLQRIPVMMKDYDAGLYRNYFQLVTTHYIAVEK